MVSPRELENPRRVYTALEGPGKAAIALTNVLHFGICWRGGRDDPTGGTRLRANRQLCAAHAPRRRAHGALARPGAGGVGHLASHGAHCHSSTAGPDHAARRPELDV